MTSLDTANTPSTTLEILNKHADFPIYPLGFGALIISCGRSGGGTHFMRFNAAKEPLNPGEDATGKEQGDTLGVIVFRDAGSVERLISQLSIVKSEMEKDCEKPSE